MLKTIATFTRNLSLNTFKLRKLPVRPFLSSSLSSLTYKFTTSKTPKMTEEQLKKVKDQGRQFYSNQVQKITELKSSAQFEKLIAGIADPIVLDLYADWCQPCKKLTPRLQTKVNSLENVKMIKINIDKCPEIAHALQVKSVPTVYLIYRGQAVDKFQGNVGQIQFNKFFDSIGKITGVSQQQKQAIQILEQAKQLIAQRKPQLSVQILQNFKQKKVTSDIIGIKQLLLAQCYLSLGKATKFKDALSRASKHQQFYQQVPDLHKFYLIMQEQLVKFEQQSKQDPTIVSLQTKLTGAQTKQQRLDAKFELVNYYKSKQLTENALQTAIQIIKEDKQWQDKKANKLVLAIFKELGNNSPLVQKYRKILQRVLS